MKRWLLAFLLLAGCIAQDPWVVPVPPQPPAPVVTDPALAYALTSQVEVGWSAERLRSHLGDPARKYLHPDGTADWSWRALDSRGEARRLEVRLDAAGTVISKVLW